MREVIRFIQNVRKHAGLKVDDRILLSIVSRNKLINRAITDYSKSIMQETLSLSISTSDDVAGGYSESVSINDAKVKIIVSKSGK